MVIIKVNPDLLKVNSTRLQTIESGMHDASAVLQNAMATAPNYNFQFKPVVAIAATEANVRIALINSRLNFLSDKLLNVANAFDATDNANLDGLWSLTVGFDRYFQNLQFLNKMSSLTGMPFSILKKFLTIGRLGTSSILGVPIVLAIINSLGVQGGNRSITDSGATSTTLKIEDNVRTNPSTTKVTLPLAVVIGGIITQRFSSGHQAVDITKDTGKDTSIDASYTGKVVFAKTVNAGMLDKAKLTTEELNSIEHNASLNYGYGNAVVVEYRFEDQSPEIQKLWSDKYQMTSGESIYALHGHMDKITVNPGDTVNAGSEIGKMGNDGICAGRTGIHLHLGYKKANSNLVDPSSTYIWGKIPNTGYIDPLLTLP